MAALAATQIAKPADEQAFERACTKLFQCLLGDPNVQANGRRGQAQDGVDLFGFRSEDPSRPVGVQCKLKTSDKTLTEREFRSEVAAALGFRPPLREYFVVTTAPDDASLQRIARELTVEQGQAGRTISINVWGWQTLEQKISEFPAAANAFDPTYGPHAQAHLELLTDVRLEQAGQKSLMVEVHGNLAEIKKTIAVSELPSDATSRNVLDAALDAEIDGYRDRLSHSQPRTAKEFLEKLLERVRHTASSRILFRIKANIGHCYLMMSDEARAAEWMTDAYHHAPSEPKAAANYALALLLRKQYHDAHTFALEGLKADPTNGSLASYAIQAAARAGDIPDSLAAIPAPLLQLAEVEAARVDILRLENRVPDWWQSARAAHAAHPDDRYLQQAAAEADIDEITQSDAFKQNARLTDDFRRRLRDAATVLHDIWERHRGGEDPARPDVIAAGCNLLSAYYALGEGEKALEAAKQLAAKAPDDGVALERAMITALANDDHVFAQTLVDRLPATSDASLTRFQFYAHTANWAKLAAYRDWAIDVPEHERVPMETLGRLANLMLEPVLPTHEARLRDILKDAETDARACVLLSDFAARMKFQDVSDLAYRSALALVNDGTHRVNRTMVGRAAARRDDWAEVIRVLDGFVDTTRPNDDLSLLITAFTNETPVSERALAFFTELPDAIRSSAYCATAFGYLQSHRGDLVAAEKWLLTGIESDPTILIAWLALFAVYVRQDAATSKERIAVKLRQLDVERAHGLPREKMGLAHFLRDAGEYQKAIELGYETARSTPNDPEVEMLYFGLIINDAEHKLVPAVSTVGVDTWIAIQSNSGERRELLIEEGPDRPAEKIYSPTHPFVAPIVGLKVEDKFVQRKSIGPDETWRVLEVKHKYLQKFHETHDFNTRFPEAKGLWSLHMQEGDVTPALDEIKKIGEQNRKVADLYIEKQLPLAMVASLSGGHAIGFAQYIRALGYDVVACLGNEPERRAAEKLALNAPDGAVLDLNTVWLAVALNLLGPLKALFGKLIIPRSVIDAIGSLQVEAMQGAGRESMSISYQDGQFLRHDYTEADHLAQAQLLAERRATLERECVVLPVDIPANANALAKMLLERCGSHTLDAAFLAAAESRILLCDDLYYRQIAHKACDAARGIWLQAAMNAAGQRGVLSSRAYAEALVGLAFFRHAHLALSEGMLLEVLALDDSPSLDRFKVVAQFIGTKKADIDSHTRVVAAFMRKVWWSNQSPLRCGASSGIVLESLLRDRPQEAASILSTLRMLLNGARLASNYLSEWCRGHFLDG